uniref:Leucine-rich repeat-containing N-terminal plant-type domain-containing protein n=1 Tax=Kalanchoe fedtschenkoi TaxID=63787 RepID=A0A7N0UVF3_KALFE
MVGVDEVEPKANRTSNLRLRLLQLLFSSSSSTQHICLSVQSYKYAKLFNLVFPKSRTMSSSSSFLLPATLSFLLLFQIASASTEEALALLQWKNSLDSSDVLSASWTLGASNATTDDSPCNWVGILCGDGGGVVKVNLSGFGVTGKLEGFSFASFPNVSYFEMSVNNLYGPIPPQISLLQKVEYLDFSLTNLTGRIPAEIGLLSRLQTLHLIYCQLSGSIPQEIGNLKALTELALYGNMLDGPIPASFGNLTSLVNLFIYQNQLSGSIPEEFGKLSNLVWLYMDTNNISGFQFCPNRQFHICVK